MVTRPEPTAVTETPRVLPPGPAAHPQREIWRLLRSHDQALKAERQQAAEDRVAARQRLVSVIVDVARAQDELSTFVTRHRPTLENGGLGLVASIERMFADSLRRAGAEVISPTGAPVDVAEMEDLEVQSSVYVEDARQTTVHTVLAPGVRLDGEVVLRPHVVLAIPATPASTRDPQDDSEPIEAKEPHTP